MLISRSWFRDYGTDLAQFSLSGTVSGMETMERWVAATDGSALGNPGHAGWAYCVAPDGENITLHGSGHLGVSTNNVGELTALAELLRAVPAERPLEVRLDSQYVLNSVSKWRFGWKKRGWRKADGKLIGNKGIIVELDELLTGRDVTFVWVKAHQVGGDPLNDHVDKAARAAATAGKAGAR